MVFMFPVFQVLDLDLPFSAFSPADILDAVFKTDIDTFLFLEYVKQLTCQIAEVDIRARFNSSRCNWFFRVPPFPHHWNPFLPRLLIVRIFHAFEKRAV